MKKFLFLGLVAIAGITVNFLNIRKNELEYLLSRLQIFPKNLKNLNIDLQNLEATFTLSLSVINPTEVGLDINTYGFISIEKIILKDPLGNPVAEANKSIQTLVLDPKSTYVIQDINVAADLSTSLSSLLNNGANFRVNLIVNILGTEYTIEG